MKTITKNINNRFNPTYFNPYLFKYGGRMKYDIGGMMLPGGMLDMSQYIPTTQAVTPQINPGIGQMTQIAGNLIGGTADSITASNNNKPYSKKSVVGGVAKGAGQGAAAGALFGPVGAAIGAGVGAIGGGISTVLGNKQSLNNYKDGLNEINTTNLLNNLPGQPQYVPTFGNGGSIHIDPSKKGTFTAAATKHGSGVQEFARHVLANKENYSPDMVKKANFARNAAKWHADGGQIPNDKLWLNNWISNRSDVLRSNLMDSSLKSFYQNNPDGVKNLIKASTTKMMSTPEEFNYQFDKPDTLGNTITDLSKGTSTIKYKGIPDSNVRVHELNHSLRLDPYISNSIKQITDGKLNSTIPDYRKNALDYYTSPNEVHSRLMEIRRMNELNPKATYSPEDVGNMRKSNFNNAKDWKEINALYELYDDETISNLLNGIVSNQSEPTTVAANGGMLPINQRVSSVSSGTTHEQSPIGGVPIGQNASVEDGEYIYTSKKGQKYVFSNRF